MKKTKVNRGFAFLLSIMMLFSQMSFPVLAATDEKLVYQTGSFCEHHAKHNEECGYTEGAPCAHEHSEDSDSVTIELDCNHQHDDACGFAKSSSCSYQCEICGTNSAKQSKEIESIEQQSKEEQGASQPKTRGIANADSAMMLAAASVSYIDENGIEQTVIATPITADTRELTSGWYYVPSSANISRGTITVNGTVNIILEEGGSLMTMGGSGMPGISLAGTNSLTIYGQIGGTGTLIANGGPAGAGIGGGGVVTGGILTINGGTVIANGGNKAAGIGGGNNAGGGTTTITGGTVYATGKEGGAGIGVGYRGEGGTFSTGVNGNAFIVASSISNKGTLSGVIFEGKIGEIYGNSITLTNNAEIFADMTLNIRENKTLVIGPNNKLINKGGVIIRSDGILDNKGSFQNQGAIYALTGSKFDRDTVQNINGGEIVSKVTANYISADGTPSSQDNVFPVRGGWLEWDEGWYVVDKDATISERIIITGDVHLILADDRSLDALRGINVGEGQSLTIYSQSGDTGKLTATGDDTNAGIGGKGGNSGGTITITGGTINAIGDTGPGIGIGGSKGGGTVTVNISGGHVIAKAEGNSNQNAIGAGGGANGTININITGGIVEAVGSRLFSGAGGFSGNVSIENAFVTTNNTDESFANFKPKNSMVFNNDDGRVYGSLRLKTDIEISAEKILIIEDQKVLNVDANTTLINRGTIEIASGGTLMNKGTVKNYGTIKGQSISGNPSMEQSTTTLSITKQDGSPLSTANSATYGDTIKITATAQKKIESITRSANFGMVDFWLGEIGGKGTKLQTSAILHTGDIAAASAELTLTNTTWTPGTYTVFADFGGYGGLNLMESTGSTTLSVTKGEQPASTLMVSTTDITFGDTAPIITDVISEDLANVTYSAAADTSGTTTDVASINDKTITIENAGSFYVKAVIGATTNYKEKIIYSDKITVSKKTIAADMMEEITEKTYNGTAIEPTPAVTFTPSGASKITLKACEKIHIHGNDCSGDFYYSYQDNLKVGTATVTLHALSDGNYQDDTSLASKSFSIVKANSTPDSLSISSSTITYGDTFSVSFSPKVLKETNIFKRLFRSGTAPAKTAQLYYGDKLIAEKTDVDENTQVIFTVNTAEKKKELPSNLYDGMENTFSVKWGGNDNMNASEGTLKVTLSKKVLAAEVNTSATKVYDGTADFHNVGLRLTNKVATDDVSATADGTATSANAQGSAFTASKIMLGGVDSDYYTLTTDAILGNVTIEQKTITADMMEEIIEKTYTGTAFEPKPTVTFTPSNSSKITLKACEKMHTHGTDCNGDFYYSYQDNLKVGTATITLHALADGNYQDDIAIASKSFSIVKANSTPDSLSISSSTITYGDTFSVSFSPKVLKETNIFKRLFRSGTAPAKTAQLYYGDKLIAEKTDVDENTQVTFNVNTAEKKTELPSNLYNDAETTFSVKWGGDDNMNASEGSLKATLRKKPLTAVVDTNDTSATKVYDGTTDFRGVKLTLTNKVATDNVSATADGTATSANAKELVFTALKTEVSEADSGYYTLATDAVLGDVSIVQKTITTDMMEEVVDKTYTGTAFEPTPALTFTPTDGAKITLKACEKIHIHGNDCIGDFYYSYKDNLKVGTATITVYSLPDGNYQDNISIASKTFIINKVELIKPTVDTSKTYIYTQAEQTLVLNGFDDETMTISEHQQTNAGNYQAVVALKDRVNYQWIDNSIEDVAFDWTIEKVTRTISVNGSANSPIQITLEEAIISEGKEDGTIMYAINSEDTVPKDGWQSESVFSNLLADTDYYFFARISQGSNYEDAISAPIMIHTPAKELLEVIITSQPNKLSYQSGEKLDLTGLVAKINYKDNISEVIKWTDGLLFATPANDSILTLTQHHGNKVSILYGGKSADTTALTVRKGEQETFAITELPEIIHRGDTFSLKASGGSGTGSVTWAVSKGEASVDADGNVTVSGVGDITIQAVKESDADYNKAVTEVTFTAVKVDHSPINPFNPEIAIDTSKNADITFRGSYADLAFVKLNGHVLTITEMNDTQAILSNYPGYFGNVGEVKSGSVNVTLYKEFLQTLSSSQYTLEVVFHDGLVEGSGSVVFKIEQKIETQPSLKPEASSKPTQTPDTGDNSNLMVWFILIIGAGGTLPVLLWLKKRNQPK